MSDVPAPSLTPVSLPAPAPAEKPKTLAEIIASVAPEALKKIPEEDKALLVIQETRQIRQVRSAPLPEPSELAAYNAIIPNAADRIMKMAESQTAHRIEIEKTVIGSQKNQAFRGQFFGLLIGMAGIGASTYAAVHGQPVFAGVLGGGTLVSLVYAFVQSKEKQRGDLDEKKQQLQLPGPAQGKKKKNRNK